MRLPGCWSTKHRWRSKTYEQELMEINFFLLSLHKKERTWGSGSRSQAKTGTSEGLWLQGVCIDNGIFEGREPASPIQPKGVDWLPSGLRFYKYLSGLESYKEHRDLSQGRHIR
jgi:hypothetical protein